MKLVRQSKSDWEQLVNLKTVKYMKEFCEKLRKRICLAKSCADWVEYLKSVRRALRVGSFCSWAPAEDKRIQTGAERRPTVEGEPSHPSPPPMLETLKSAAGSSNRSKPGDEKIRARQPKKCSGCGELPTFAPKGTSSENRAWWHSSHGWCPNKKAFVTGGICPECNKKRADDSENHMANGFCKTMGRFPRGRRGS